VVPARPREVIRIGARGIRPWLGAVQVLAPLRTSAPVSACRTSIAWARKIDSGGLNSNRKPQRSAPSTGAFGLPCGRSARQRPTSCPSTRSLL
jgi:hypothetical protein